MADQHTFPQGLIDEDAAAPTIGGLYGELDADRTTRVELHGWEEFDEPVDRIISIEAIEAFPQERYAPFFKMCSSVLPEGGRFELQARLLKLQQPMVAADVTVALYMHYRLVERATGKPFIAVTALR